MQVEVAELSRIRVERDLTYAALAAQIGVTTHTLYRLLTKPRSQPNERTAFKIRRWLEQDRQRSAA